MSLDLSPRDKKLVTIIVPIVVLAALWFLVIAPQRSTLSTITAQAEKAKSEQTTAETNVQRLEATKASYADDYGAVVRLGKAIPKDVDMPSLLVQLESASKGAHIAFDSIDAGTRVAAAGATGTTAGASGSASGGSNPTAAGGTPAQSGPGKAAETANGAAATSDQANAKAGGTTSSSGTAGASGAAAPALDTVPLTFDFDGSYFDLADFFHRLKRFVRVANNDAISVKGRLMTIDALTFESSEDSGKLKAHVSATVYLAPASEGTTAGATSQGPAATPASTPAPSPSSGASGATTTSSSSSTTGAAQ